MCFYLNLFCVTLKWMKTCSETWGCYWEVILDCCSQKSSKPLWRIAKMLYADRHQGNYSNVKLDVKFEQWFYLQTNWGNLNEKKRFKFSFKWLIIMTLQDSTVCCPLLCFMLNCWRIVNRAVPELVLVNLLCWNDFSFLQFLSACWCNYQIKNLLLAGGNVCFVCCFISMYIKTLLFVELWWLCLCC